MRGTAGSKFENLMFELFKFEEACRKEFGHSTMTMANLIC